MDSKVSIYFSTGKDLSIVLKDSEFKTFLADMASNKPHFNEDKKSGYAVPLFNVLYYTFAEYTDEMKQADADRVKAAQEATKPTTTKDEAKEIKESK